MMGAQGARIILNGRNEERLQSALHELGNEGIHVHAIPGDVSKVGDCQRLIEQTVKLFGRLDVLINNAGISSEGRLEEINPDTFKKVLDVNVLGSVYPSQCAIPHLKKTNGHLIFIGSGAGIRGLPNYSAYSTSKMALTALAESLRIELQGSGIHVGLAYVGFTENDPDKMVYNKDGKLIPQPKRDFVKPEPPERVAGRIIEMIEKRRFKRVFSTLGKLNATINRWVPALGEFILRRNFRKQR